METPDYLGDGGPIYESNNGANLPKHQKNPTALSVTEMKEMTYGPKARAFQAEQAAWKSRTSDLAEWVLDTLVIRNDAYGKYAINRHGKSKKWKEDGQVDQRLLERHFAQDTAQIGLYTTSIDDQCRWLAIDIDCHDGDDSGVGSNNQRFALYLYQKLVDLGFQPLLIDSNGRGGFHLFVLFQQAVSARDVRAFGRWLVADYEDFGLPGQPEVFPKQDTIKGRYGNLVRLFGRHYKRTFYSRVWDGHQFQRGEAAIEIILGKTCDTFDLVPESALEPVSEEQKPDGLDGKQADDWWKQYDGDLRTLDMKTLFESKGLTVTPKADRQLEVTCPWADEHTTGDNTASILLPNEDGNKFPTFRCFHAHCEGRGIREVLAHFGKDAVDQHCASAYRQRSTDPPVVNPNDPMAAARLLYKDYCRKGTTSALHHYQGDWWLWDERKYVERTNDDVRAAVWGWLDGCSRWTKEGRSGTSKLVPLTPNRNIVSSVIDALKAIANLPDTLEMPCWIRNDDLPASENLITFDNGLLDLEHFIATGKTKLIDHSPNWFSPTCLPHKFDAGAKCPNWISFLSQVMEGDQDRIDALAQWFGYCLTWDTRQQKMALLIGPPRSGKGTTMAILTAMLGSENVASPDLTSLGRRFGLAPLIGKQVAIVPDAHLGRMSDAVAILERLKSIVGGDRLNVDRKAKSELTNIPIKTRFSVSVNELPRLPDASAALKSRLIVFPFPVAFEGREDFSLRDRLLAEIPGITNWALAGLRDFRKAGRLLQPKAGQDILDDFVRLSSPVKAFLDDCCDVAPDATVASSDLQEAWKNWCQQNGHEAGSVAVFGTRLRAALPGLRRHRQRADGGQAYVYQGVQLKAEVGKDVINRRKGGGLLA